MGNVILVDTPGIGESEDLDNILLEVLPQAVSFIFVVNARNAGGIHEDRLSRIFKNIWKNSENMPCFDPLEVFFLTSQWDIVEEDDDDDDNPHENDNSRGPGSRTWKLILDKLKKGWPGVDDDRIFQISLKKIDTTDGKKYTEEFQRFEANLSKTIIRNRNKRVEFYLRFLQNFMRNAERGIAARLNLLLTTEEKQTQVLLNHLERIERLEVENHKCQLDLETHKSKVLHVLSDMLFQYLHSNSAKEEIFNPEGGISIVDISQKVESVIRSRLNDVIEKWFFNPVVEEKMKEANKRIMLALDSIQVEVENIELDMTGLKPQSLLNENVVPRLPIVINQRALLHVYLQIYMFVREFSDIFNNLIIGPKGRLRRADELFENVLKTITMKKLQEYFANSFGEQYSRTISRVFDNEIPNKIRSMRKTNKKMMEENLTLRSKHGLFVKLNTLMKNLKAEIQKYQDTYS